MYAKFVFFFLLIVCMQTVNAQEGSTNKQIDSLLSEWNRPNVPALSIAVVKGGKPVYQQQYGMANIKEGTRNNPGSLFWIASVSKQFTAAGIYLLAKEKKLSLSQSLLHYFPALPSIYKPVTINHLLHHTSGIRDGFVLTALSKKPEALYTNENVVKYKSLQTALNFSPGAEYEYNNGGYVLLALIIEKASGLSFPEFMKSKLFLPLGMKDTYVAGKVPVEANMTRGYHAADSSFEEGSFQGNTYGSSSVVTTLSDMIRWAQVMQHPQKTPWLAPVIRELLETGELNGRKKIAYAGGLEKFVYKGKTVYEHFGADEGYKANIIYFPSTQLTVIGMTNNSTEYRLWRLLYSVADVVHGERNDLRNLPESEEPVSTSYFYTREGLPAFRVLQRFSSYAKLSTSPGGYGVPYKISGDALESLDPIPSSFILNEKALISVDRYYGTSRALKSIVPSTTVQDLNSFVGEYVSGEVETSYRISSDNNQLFFEFAPELKLPLFRLTDTDFVFDYSGPNFIQFTKEGFLFSRDGCRQLAFKKRS